jgi:hypothetical protein
VSSSWARLVLRLSSRRGVELDWSTFLQHRDGTITLAAVHQLQAQVVVRCQYTSTSSWTIWGGLSSSWALLWLG